MYRKILVPTDGSDTATSGLKEAIKLAKDQGAQIRIIHVVDEMAAVSPNIYGALFQQLVDQLRANGATVVANARALVQQAGVPVDTRMVEALGSQAGEYILQAAAEWPANLIVCGTHGRRGLRRVVTGSDAEYILRRSPVPVLLVRAAEPAE
jgi:nucleotide-binding universal stress UspA family protein